VRSAENVPDRASGEYIKILERSYGRLQEIEQTGHPMNPMLPYGSVFSRPSWALAGLLFYSGKEGRNAMPRLLLVIALTGLGGALLAQQTDRSNQPNVFLENKSKPPKDSPYRTIEGTVKDESDNPARGAIVQLKDTKTSNVVSFPTREDGKFVFRELSMSVDYELLAKRDDVATPIKKVSVYDTRKNVVVNFRLEPPPKQP
jgi:hypothetical protein